MSHTIRQAMRAYHCYECKGDHKQMVNMNDLGSVRCPTCQSDFLEEQKTFADIRQVM
jgi:DNA-directed RNA polymerase subunit RPC12/RpoP